MKYAPILIPTLCRFKLFKQCVESLSHCTGAQDTVLYIALDYPLNDSHVAGYNQIKEYIPSIVGFKRVETIYRNQNYGAAKNYRDAMDYIFMTYDSLIFTEDDNEFSPNFLEYINKGLELYESNDRVISISGYNYPIHMKGYNKNAYANYQFSAWGVGLWKNKVQFYTDKDVKKWLRSPFLCIKVLFRAPASFISILIRLKRNELYGDSCNVVGSIINKKLSVFPTISKVRNCGRDGSGLHGKADENDPCNNQTIDSSDTFEYDDIDLKSQMDHQVRHYFNKILFKAIKRSIKRLF